jgi:AsmA protein
MTKTLKILGLILILLVALIIIAILALPKLVDSEAAKQQISQQVKRHTGQTLTIDGDFSLSVFPWLGFRTGAVSLTQAEDIGKGNFLHAEALNLHIKLLPLLKRQVEVDTVLLQAPKLHLIVNENGKSSLDALAEKVTEPTNDNQTTPTKFDKVDSSPLAAIVVSGINISDGEFIYENRQLGETHTLKNFNLRTGNLLSTKSEDIEISGDLFPHQMDKLRFTLRAKARIDIDSLNAELENTKLSFSGKLDPNSSTEQQIDAEITSLQVDQAQQNLAIDGFLLRATDGNLAPEFFIPKMQIDLKNQKTSTIDFLLTEKVIGFEANGNITVKDWQSNATAIGKIATNTFAPSSILRQLAIDYTPSDSSALQTFQLGTQFTATNKGASLKQIKVVLDESHLSGDISVIHFTKPQFRFDLILDKFNIDNYLPVSAETQASSSEEDTQLALAVPIAIFKEINANGIFRAKTIIANGATLSDINVSISSSNRKVVIVPNAKLYQGSLDGRITFNELSDQSTLQIQNNFNLVDFGSLLQDTQITDQLSGLGTINTNITITEKNGVQTNTGTIGLAVKNGALKGINIKNILDSARAKLRQLKGKEVQAKSSENDETQFTEMLATLSLNNNVFTNKDLAIKAPAFRIGGNGAIDLNQQSLNYTTNIDIVETSSGQGGKNRDELNGITIPVKFTGPLTNPKPKIDFSALIKANTKKDVDRKKAELKAKAAKKLGLTKEKEQEGETTQSQEEQLKDKLKNKLLDKLF